MKQANGREIAKAWREVVGDLSDTPIEDATPEQLKAIYRGLSEHFGLPSELPEDNQPQKGRAAD